MPRLLLEPVRNLILIVLLGAAAAASWWWSRPAPVEAPRSRASGDQDLGYYLRGARMLGTDESGRVAYKIFADRLDERPGEDRLLLERVQIDYHPPDQMPWVITAGSGSATRDRSEIELADGVEIQSQPTDGRAPVHVTTSKLRFLPLTSLAETDQHVVDERRQLARRGKRAAHAVEGRPPGARIRGTWPVCSVTF